MSARSDVAAIARKELRGYFHSAVALIFLASFLGVTLFTFFWYEKFFARDLADVRPLFDWLPLLLIVLVSALSMRLWSEEHKLGTIEVLMTLPVPHHRLVLGKFVAGMALVGLALLLTLGLPITVSMMGDLDWGPVIGGYLAALLLAGAYLAIGLCVSAATDNQIISLLGTAVVCGLLYVPENLTRVFGARSPLRALADVAGALDTDVHFASITRGVLDLRDLAYYASLIAIFLALNVLLLRARTWSRGRRTREQRVSAVVMVGLIAANAVALNLWLAPVTRTRVDLTEHGEFSLSPATHALLGSLDQPLTIRGFFSDQTHSKLAPLMPQLRDLLEEYRIAGDGKVKVEIVDPSSDEDLEREVLEQYDIRSFPVEDFDRRSTSVLNIFFNIVVEYGDQHAVLSFQDLLEITPMPADVEVRLRNPEYDLTRTIKKVVYGFQSVDALFAALPGKVELKAYVTPTTLPPNWKELPDKLTKVVDKLREQSGGKLEFTTSAPTTDAERQALFDRYRFKPFATSLGSPDVFYAHLVLSVAGHEEPFLPPDQLSEAALEADITDRLKRAAPGFIKRVGLWTPPPPPPKQPSPDGRPPRPERPPQSFDRLRQALERSYQVDAVDLASGRVDDAIEVLLLAGPVDLDDEARRAVDQFVMRGGSLIVLAGRYRLDLAGGQLAVQPVRTGLEDLLTAWGVEVQPQLVLDEANDAFPIPITRDLGNGMQVRDMQLLPYPFFVKVGDGLADGHPATARMNAAIFHWASPVKATAKAAAKAKADGADKAASAGAETTVEVLARSSDASWMQASTQIQPDFRGFPETGFGKPASLTDAEKGARDLAVAVTGSFTSAVAGKEAVAKDAAAKDAAAKDGEDATAGTERLVEQSPPGTRVVVIGSSSFVSDEVMEISRSTGSKQVLNNEQLIENLVDWAVADVDLLGIRSRGSYTRTLEVPQDERGRWELINYAVVLLGLGAVIGGGALRRRARGPMALDPIRTRGASSADQGARS